MRVFSLGIVGADLLVLLILLLALTLYRALQANGRTNRNYSNAVDWCAYQYR